MTYSMPQVMTLTAQRVSEPQEEEQNLPIGIVVYAPIVLVLPIGPFGMIP